MITRLTMVLHLLDAPLLCTGPTPNSAAGHGREVLLTRLVDQLKGRLQTYKEENQQLEEMLHQSDARASSEQTLHLFLHTCSLTYPEGQDKSTPEKSILSSMACVQMAKADVKVLQHCSKTLLVTTIQRTQAA